MFILQGGDSAAIGFQWFSAFDPINWQGQATAGPTTAKGQATAATAAEEKATAATAAEGKATAPTAAQGQATAVAPTTAEGETAAIGFQRLTAVGPTHGGVTARSGPVTSSITASTVHPTGGFVVTGIYTTCLTVTFDTPYATTTASASPGVSPIPS